MDIDINIIKEKGYHAYKTLCHNPSHKCIGLDIDSDRASLWQQDIQRAHMSSMSRSLAEKLLAENRRTLEHDVCGDAMFSVQRLPPRLSQGDMTPHLKFCRSRLRLMTYQIETALKSKGEGPVTEAVSVTGQSDVRYRVNRTIDRH